MWSCVEEEEDKAARSLPSEPYRCEGPCGAASYNTFAGGNVGGSGGGGGGGDSQSSSDPNTIPLLGLVGGCRTGQTCEGPLTIRNIDGNSTRVTTRMRSHGEVNGSLSGTCGLLDRGDDCKVRVTVFAMPAVSEACVGTMTVNTTSSPIRVCAGSCATVQKERTFHLCVSQNGSCSANVCN